MRKVIFTCITGEYDTLKEPLIKTRGWEYICFTNNKDLVKYYDGIWEVHYRELKEVKDQRKIKILQFTEYDLSIWIDGSILINCDLNEFIEKYHKTNFTTLLHPHRKCIYEEAEACIKLKKDSKLTIGEQVYDYKKKGLPRDVGMIGSGLIIRTNSKENEDFCNKWWSEVERYSKRDQLSFNYIMYFNRIKYNLIPFSILKNEFILNRHNKK